MYNYIRMSRTKITIVADGPLLPGSISTAKTQCGKPNCACKASPPKLHGTYYRWTGLIKRQRTTKTISKPEAQDCAKRIKNYRALEGRLRRIFGHAFAHAP